MATTNTEHYVRLTLLTFDGGTWICKEILVRELNRIPGSPGLSSLLQTNKKAIKRKLNNNTISGKQYHILKETISNETYLNNWDVQLLVKMILFLFDSTLPGIDRAYLKDILAVRNELICHRSQASINQQQFLVNWTKMTCCLNGLSSGLEDLTRQGATKIIQDLSSGPLDLQSSISKIAEHCRNDEHMEEVHAALSRIENTQDQLATGIDSANYKADVTHCKLDDLKARLVEWMERGNHQWNIDIPILQSNVHISCESEELGRLLPDVLVKVFKTAINKQNVDQTDPAAVSRAVREWLDELESMDATVVTAEKGSILLCIRCNTVQALFSLLNMYQKSGNRIRLVGIENTLNEVYKTDTKLELVLVEESTELISIWIDEMPHTSELTLGIQCRSLDTVLQVTDYFQNGSAANRLNQLSKALSAGYANERVRVDATLGIGEFTDALTSNNEALVTEGTQSTNKNVPTTSIQETVQTHPTSATVEVNRELTKTIPEVTSLGKRVAAEPTADEAEDVASLKESSEKFQEFLQKNDLLQDLTRFSSRVEDHDQILFALEEQEKNIGVAIATRQGPSCSLEEQRKDLQTLLKIHYRDTCLVVQDPTEDSDIELNYLYAEPAVRVLRQRKGRDVLTNVKEEAESMSCKKIFYTDDYSAREIYITGDAGLGKSLLCKHLVELWCEAHGDCSSVVSDDNDSDSDEEGLWSLEQKRRTKIQRHAEQKARREENRQILSQFKFLFYITLRDSLSEYTITEMIQSQILQYYEDIKHVKVSDVLENECCLVIVDGLDEWVCPEGRKVPHFVNPGIPGREVSYEKTVFLTTTRPWKFDVLRLTNVDKHAELCGIDKPSASQLCSKVIKLLNKNETERKRKREFYRALKQKGLDHFKTIPVILIQLICLWFDDQELCKSQVQLYCSMLNMLLKKAQNKLTEQTTQTPSSVQSETPLHECFMDHPHCQNYQQLINCLSEVAFEALVDKTKENQLVFESSIMRIHGVDEDSINLCLKLGILSQNKMYVKRSVSEKKFSFLHKKFQEFLASVFIANSEDVQNVSKRLTEFCSTVKGCLEMSQVWLFVSGMRPDIARQLLDHFTNVITADTDKLMKNYRQTIFGEGLILDIQTCVTNCISEGESNGHKYEKIHLNDVYIDKDTLRHVERMLLGNVWSGIKSVYINTRDMTVDQLALITGQLGHTKSLEKLYLVDERSRIPSETLETVLDKCTDSMTCLRIGIGVNNIELEHGSVSAICRSISKRLMSLCLHRVKLTHVDKVELLHKLSQSSSIRELYLELHCTDHDDPHECKPRIDVSTMTQLQTLRLYDMCVDNLPTVTQCMKWVLLGFVTLSMTTLCEFARNISQTKRHVQVELIWVTVREESEDRVDLKTFLRERPGLTVTLCEYRDSDKTWWIAFHTDSKT